MFLLFCLWTVQLQWFFTTLPAQWYAPLVLHNLLLIPCSMIFISSIFFTSVWLFFFTYFLHILYIYMLKSSNFSSVPLIFSQFLRAFLWLFPWTLYLVGGLSLVQLLLGFIVFLFLEHIPLSLHFSYFNFYLYIFGRLFTFLSFGKVDFLSSFFFFSSSFIEV